MTNVFQTFGNPPSTNNEGQKLPSEKLANPFSEVVARRRSIRLFNEETIPKDVMQAILAEALLAPTSSNLQPFQLHWVENPTMKQSLVSACLNQPAASTAAELIVVVARPDLWNHNRQKLIKIMTDNGKSPLSKPVAHYYQKLLPFVHRSDPMGMFNLARRIGFTLRGWVKPTPQVGRSESDHRVWAHIQASLVAQTLMLSICSRGYDSCPMGGFDKNRIRKLLSLPRRSEVNMVIAAGKRKPEGLYGPRYRLPFDHLVFHH